MPKARILVGAFAFIFAGGAAEWTHAQQPAPAVTQACREIVPQLFQIEASRPSVAVVPGQSGDRNSCRATLQFLSGCDEAGHNCLPNAAPAAWQRVQLQRGEASTASFFCGKGRTQSGIPCADRVAPNGIDSGPRLVFYAGHGVPTSWKAQQEDVELKRVLLGDQELRYFWQCSCNVMAHGVRIDLGAGLDDYYEPDSYFYSAGGADDPRKRNVFARWAAAASPRLRLACGGSSGVCAESGEVANRIWDDFNNRGFDVADSFLEGVFNARGGVPLCLAQGDEAPEKSTLFDRAFVGDANSAEKLATDKRYLYLSYPAAFGEFPLPVEGGQEPPKPGIYPVIHVADLAVDVPPGFHADKGLLLSQDTVEGRGAKILIEKKSRATYVRGVILDHVIPLGSGSRKTWGDMSEFYIKKAQEIIEKNGWTEALAASPQAARIVIERTRLDTRGADLQRFQKNVVVRIKRLIPVTLEPGKTELVPVIGAGGEMVVQLNNDGSLRNAAKIWRPITVPGADDKKRKVRDPLEALQALLGEAIKGPSSPPGVVDSAVPQGFEQIYDLRPEHVPYVWGYKEESGNCRQRDMWLVYQFTFLPKPDYREKGYQPLTLDVPAQDDGSPESRRTRFCEPLG
jgi:hypothetical protein